ncbi:SNF2 family N-terminal domain-containing protein [Pilobolus umbonatus]|nr:SNF2 family N-terminal domain-containing protein [Pilobolus umbonatus]
MYPNKTVSEIKEALKRTNGNLLETSKLLILESKPLISTFKKVRIEESDSDSESEEEPVTKVNFRDQVILKFFNTAPTKEIQDVTGCKGEAASILVDTLRPFADMDDLHSKLKKQRGMSVRYIESYAEMMNGYSAVDQIIAKIEHIGTKLRKILDIWQGSQQETGEGETHLASIQKMDMQAQGSAYKDAMKGYLVSQPKYVNKEMKLKDYQIIGVNWMLLLYRKKISGILADEMGLGKTAQVISFLARLYEMGERGPHLIIVPSSTIENWMREFERFCPTLEVRTYHGSQTERADLRYELEDKESYQVLLTTYNIATGQPEDRNFLRKLNCQSMILDEGHMVKNCTSSRYKYLMKIRTPFRLLLTGTPLQNNLQELISLLTFIMPDTFQNFEDDIRNLFKIRSASYVNMEDKGKETAVQVLSRTRIMRAKKMMTPFVLRRKKENVLKDLPSKVHLIERCPMTPVQKKVYTDIIDSSRVKVNEGMSDMDAQYADMSNLIMHLRKAADHPMLFRNIYTDDILRVMAKLVKSDVNYWDSEEKFIYEDMTVMSDYELNELCKEVKTIHKYELSNEEWMDSGKVKKLKELLPKYKKDGRKVLIFSQFTKMLDILQMVLATMNITYLRLDGNTKVMERQSMIDDFNDDGAVDVFLLSTKAGGFGINLTSANVVILYDQDFNPQNDKQAEDRAHRVGQTRDVTVIRLVSENTCDEYILTMADIKLRLDKTISSEDGEEVNDPLENRQALIQCLKQADKLRQ